MPARFKVMLPLFILALVGLACSLPSIGFLQPKPTPAGDIRPSFANHPAPAIQMDLKPFQDAGCKIDPENQLRCPPNLPPFDQIGCDEIVQADPLMGGLRPDTSLMLCLIEPTDPNNKLDPNDYLYNQGCEQNPIYVRFVIYMNGKFSLVKNRVELKTAFAPIESADEALSYAIARTGYQALYGLKDENLRYKAAKIEDSSVQPAPDGYFVRLFSYNLCGCGPHSTDSVTVDISKEAGMVAGTPTPVWEDPAKDDLCVD